MQPSDVLNLLQKSIASKVEDNVPKTTPLLSILKSNVGVIKLANNTFYVTEWVGNFSNIGQFAAGSQLAGGKAQNVQLNIGAKRLYAHISVDEFTVEAMKDVPDGALIDFTKGYTDRMELGVGRELNRTYNGNTDGKVARANGSSASGTALTVQALDADTSDLEPTQYIEPNDYIIIGEGEAVQVSSIAGNVLTLAAARAWSDEDAIVKASKDGGSTDEMSGLKSLIVATGTVQGVNVANYKNLQAYVDAAAHSIASVKEAPMQKAFLKTVGRKVSQKMIGLANLTVFDAWASTLTALKQTANTNENIAGGINLQGDSMEMPYLKFMGGKVYMDIDTYTGHWFNLDPASMTIGDMGGGVKFSKDPNGGGVWTRKQGYTPEYESTLRFYGNLIVKNPRSNSLLSGLTA